MKFLHLFFFVSLLFFTACQGQDKSKTVATANTSTKVELIDFYGTHRCVTCEAIEANAKYTVETYFKDAVKEGKLEFKIINVDEKENYNMAEKFEATGTALFINVINKGQENHIDLTNFAFQKGKDKEVFSAELKQKLEEQLNTL